MAYMELGGVAYMELGGVAYTVPDADVGEEFGGVAHTKMLGGVA